MHTCTAIYLAFILNYTPYHRGPLIANTRQIFYTWAYDRNMTIFFSIPYIGKMELNGWKHFMPCDHLGKVYQSYLRIVEDKK